MKRGPILHPDRCFSASRLQRLAAATLIALLLLLRTGSLRAGDPPVGVVSHIKVLSDKVADVSSLEAWKNSFIKPGMTDDQKVVTLWKSSVSFVYQDAPPIEFLHEGCVHDTIKSFNVYGPAVGRQNHIGASSPRLVAATGLHLVCQDSDLALSLGAGL